MVSKNDPARRRSAQGRAMRRGAPGAALALALLAAAHGQELPLGFSIGPGVSVEHDSNFLRSAGAAISGVPVFGDTFYDTFVAGNLLETYGRQTVTASANVGRVKYVREPLYDFTQEDLRARLDSEFPYGIRTSIGADRATSLARFADIGTSARDVIGRNGIDASLIFPLHVEWQAVLLGNLSSSDNSSPGLQAGNVRTKEVDAGIRFVPSSGNHVDLLLRDTLGTYPNGSPSVLVSPHFRELGADLRADWTFSGASQLVGRAGFLERRNDDIEQQRVVPGPTPHARPYFETLRISRNFAGPAYDLTYNWRLTGAARLSAFAIRESGAAGDYNYLSAVNKSFRLTPNYQPDEKIGLDAYYEWSRRDYFDSYAQLLQLAAGTKRVDFTRNTGIDATWKPRHWLQVTLTGRREKRASDLASYAYANNVVALAVQATFH